MGAGTCNTNNTLRHCSPACRPQAQLPSAEQLVAGLQPAGNPAGQQTAQHNKQLLLPNGVQLPPEPPRVRIFPHVEGNYATVVYITVEEPAQAQLQELALDLLSNVSAATADSSASVLHLWPTFPWSSTYDTAAAPAAAAASAPAQQQSSAREQQSPQQQEAPADSQQQQQQQSLPLHISISRTVPIKRIQADSLQAALTKQLKPFKACRVQLQGLLCLVNDPGSRSFMGVKVAAGEKQVVRMVEAVNRAFITHGLQPFYEDPLPHVSLAWTPGNHTGRLQPWLDRVNHGPIALKVSQVVCQVGKVRHVVWQG